MSYRELEAAADSIAQRLKYLEKNAVVALRMEPSPQFVAAALAILKLGAAYLPLDPAWPPERIAFILKEARVPIVIVSAGLQSSLPLEHPRLILEHAVAPTLGLPVREAITTPNQLAYVIYTSGSTGKPKGVQITHANLLHLVLWHHSAFSVSSSDRATVLSSPGFDACVWEIWPYLCAGASLHIPDKETRLSPDALQSWMLKERITISFAATPLAERLISLKWPGDTPLRFLLTGSDVLHRYPSAELPFPLINNYGPTECTVVSTSGVVPASHSSAKLACAVPSIGKSIGDTKIFILDEHLNPVANGVAGELCISGPGVSAGYLGDDRLTAEKFVMWSSVHTPQRRIYRTGDLACVRSDGEIDFLGRIDDQIKIDGHRIEPAEICGALCKHTTVHSCVVTARQNSSGQKHLVAYVVLNAVTDTATLRKYLLERLPQYMIPSVFVRMESLPVTTAGKIDRSVLPAPTNANMLSEEATASPLTSTQSRVTSILAHLLDAGPIQPTDNFFLLGGHSLLGAQLLAQIQEAFGVVLTLRDIFDHPSAQGISLQIDRALASPSIFINQAQESLPWESLRNGPLEP